MHLPEENSLVNLYVDRQCLTFLGQTPALTRVPDEAKVPSCVWVWVQRLWKGVWAARSRDQPCAYLVYAGVGPLLAVQLHT